MSEVNALKFAYTESPGAPVILYLHGFMGCKEDWEEVVSITGDRFSHLRIDIPGRIPSGFTDSDYTMPGCGQLVAGLLNDLGVGQCHIVGYSMGGRLALYFAVHHADRVGGIVIESGSPGLRTEREQNERIHRDRQLAEAIIQGDLESFVSTWYAQPLFAEMDQTSDRFKRLLERRLTSDRIELAKSLRYMGTGVQPSLWKRLPTVSSHLLFLTGEKDAKFRAIGAETADLCPRGELAIIAGAGHNIHFEQPEEYCSRICRFFDRDS